MKIIEVHDRSRQLIEQLVDVWESSVKETHLFLSEEEISHIKEYVPKALKSVSKLIITVDDNNRPIAFMGIDDNKLEMLFVAASNRKQGIGKKLFNYALEKYSIDQLVVNEQNKQALGFYLKMGFSEYKRSNLDEQGEPHPIIFMHSKSPNS